MQDKQNKWFAHIVFHWPLLVLGLIGILAYSTLAILRHLHFESGGNDLGIFDQVIWHYSRFQAPASSIEGLKNILGDHFHPILALLSPIYWIYPHVEILLVAQAVLLVIPIIPIYLFVSKRLGSLPAYLISASYMIFWGIQTAMNYDFHEVAVAVPLIAFAIYFLDKRAWIKYLICAVLLLLVKEDQSILVVFFGLYIFTLKSSDNKENLAKWRMGILSIIMGGVWFLLVIKVLIPFFSGTNRAYGYWKYDEFGHDPISALKSVILKPWRVVKVAISPRIKLNTELYIFFPFLFLVFLSPLLILTIPLILERFLSSSTLYWAKDFHYTATISPILAMASADGLYNLTKLQKLQKVKNSIIVISSLLILIINLALLPKFPLWSLTNLSYYRLTSSDVTGYKALSLIPSNASVVAQDAIVPHLTERNNIYELFNAKQDANYIIASQNISPWPGVTFSELKWYLNQYESRGYKIIFNQNGWLVLQHKK